MDGSVQPNPRMKGFGGLIRVSKRDFMHGFHCNIDYLNILHAEILTLLYVIQICWEDGLRNIICYSDFIHTIHLVHHVDVFTHQCENEVDTIRKYMDND